MGTIANTVVLTSTSNTTFTIPADFASFISVEAFGAGGKGGANATPGGGGGGSYAKSTSVTGLSAGVICHYKAGLASGTGGSANTTGRSWFSTSTGEPTAVTNGVLAEPGLSGSTTGGAGGATATSIGDVKFAGGTGGAGPSAGAAGGGGGCANAGGVGGNGGLAYTPATPGTTGMGGGGGAASLTHAGYNGGNGTSIAGGIGGNGGDNTSSFGSGSGGQGAGLTPGASFSYYNFGTYGPGGGGGGNGTVAQTPNYGFGAGGGGNGTGASGSAGGVIFTYNAYIAPNITAIQPPTGDYRGGTTVTILGQGFSNATSVTFDGTAIANTIVSDTNITFVSPPKPNETVSTIIVTNPFGTNSITYNNGVVNFNQYQPYTGFNTTDPNTNKTQDLGQRYTTKSYLLDVYPNIASQLGARTAPGLFAWGENTTSQGALGLGDIIPRSSPVQVGSLTNWKQLAAGVYHSAGISTDGKLWVWGINSSGQLGQINITSYSSPVQVGSLTNWKQISCSQDSTMAIKTDGSLWAWGDNSNGGLGLGNIIASSSPVQVGLLTNWKQVTTGVESSGALAYSASIKTDGTLWAWGNNVNGQLGLGDVISRSSPVQVGLLSNWKMVNTGMNSGAIMAVKTDGTLWGWGYNVNGQLGLGDIVYRSSPVQVGLLTNWKQVSEQQVGSLAIKTDGTLWAWGNNVAGRLGLGNQITYSSPVQVGSLTNWKFVSSGLYHSIALKTDGTLWGWGQNLYGQLGLNTGVNYYSSPVQIGLLTNWKQVQSGGFHTLTIADGYI